MNLAIFYSQYINFLYFFPFIYGFRECVMGDFL